MNDRMKTAEGTLGGESPGARLPSAWSALMSAYPLHEGYSVQTEFLDALSLMPSLQEGYARAIQAGRKPEEVGLPVWREVLSLGVCRAWLCNAHGQVLAMATAAKALHNAQDIEDLETRACQRLVVALDLGEDRPEAPAPQKGCPDAEVPAAVVTAVASGSVVDGAQENAAPAGGVSQSLEDRVLVGLRRQIDHQARLRGVIPPVVTTRAEAQAALRDLLATG
jgi:hypothetical protein